MIIALLLFQTLGHAQRMTDRGGRYVPFSERITELEQRLETARGDERISDLIALAEVHFQNAELYTLIWQASAAINELYYGIMEGQNRDAGVASKLYRGIGFFELGEHLRAKEMFTAFLTNRSPVPGQLESRGRAWLGAVYYLENNRDQALQQWGRLPQAERNACSVLAYVQARIGFNVEDVIRRCNGVSSSELRGKNILPLIQTVIAADQFDRLPQLVRRADIHASFIEHEGSAREIRYFDPSAIVTLAQAHYALAVYYAEQANHERLRRYYRGAFYYNVGRFDQAIRTLIGIDDLRSAIYLAASYYKSGEKKLASDVFDYIERTGDSSLLAQLAVVYAEAGVTERQERAIALAERSIQSVRGGRSGDVPQDMLRKFGQVYFYQKEYEKAVELLSTAFRSERRGDLRANAPDFITLYAASIVLSRNFINISEAIDMFSTVMHAYPASVSLVEMTSLIDVATNIGREGRVIHRR